MEELDVHERHVAAPPAATWAALVATLDGLGRVPAPLAAAWGLDPAARRGDPASPAVGDALPGFAVAEVREPAALELRGRHRFSAYALRFTLDPAGAGTRLRVRTSAEFPGAAGRLYRALVVGSGGHVLVTRQLLARVARRAAG